MRYALLAAVLLLAGCIREQPDTNNLAVKACLGFGSNPHVRSYTYNGVTTTLKVLCADGSYVTVEK